MMEKDTSPLNLTDRAAEWLAMMNSDAVSDADKASFAEWLKASPDHQREYLGQEALWAEIRGEFGGDLEAVFADNLWAGQSPTANVASLGQRRRIRPAWLTSWPGMAAAAVVLLMLSSLYLMRPEQIPGAIHATAVGGQKTISLADNSTVILNTDSVIAVAMTRAARNVRLVRGEALFDVAKDSSRPFLVSAGDGVIRVTGTRFNVLLRDDDTVVTVLEGQVEVQPLAAPEAAKGTPEVLAAGEQVVYDGPAGVVRASGVNLAAIGAWRERKLIFDVVPLSGVVREFNRYVDGRVIIADADLGDVKITGTFAAGEIETFVKSLTSATGIRAVYLPGDVALLMERE